VFLLRYFCYIAFCIVLYVAALTVRIKIHILMLSIQRVFHEVDLTAKGCAFHFKQSVSLRRIRQLGLHSAAT